MMLSVVLNCGCILVTCRALNNLSKSQINISKSLWMGLERQYSNMQPRLTTTALTSYYQPYLLYDSLDHSIFSQLKANHFLAAVWSLSSLGSMAKLYTNILKSTAPLYFSATPILLIVDRRIQNFVSFVFS